MNSIRHLKTTDLPAKHKAEHEGYEYLRRDFVRRGETSGTQVSIYEIPPQKSAYPDHDHLKDEETFFILSGEGLLKTPEGERTVHAGELLFFPTGSAGAHKLTNPSPTEKLVYIDFDVIHDLDAAVYPDSGKIGLWGQGINRLWRIKEDTGYYDGE